MSDVFIALLVVVLAWPWNLAFPSADSVDPGTQERTHAHFWARRPARSSRGAHARRWSLSTTTAYWEDSEEEEERGGKDVGTGQCFAEWSAARVVGYPHPVTDVASGPRPHLLGIPLDRLCRLRC